MKEIRGIPIGYLDARYVNETDRLLMPPVEDWHDPTGGLPADPAVGDRYISDATAGGWTIDYIYEWDGDEWVEYPPEEGWMVWMLIEFMFYMFFSGGWAEVGDKVGVDMDAAPGYLGAASDDGVLRTGSPISYTDGGDFVTLDLDINSLDAATIAAGDFVPFWDITATATNKKITFANLEGLIDHGNLTGLDTGADHSYIDQDVTTTGTPTFGITTLADASLLASSAAPTTDAMIANKKYVDDTAGGGGGATTALDNLASVAINLSLTSDTDITDDLGTGDIRWRDIHAATLNSGLTATDTLKLRGRDVDGSAYVDILTITSADTVTADLNALVTIGGNAILDDTSTASALTSVGVLTILQVDNITIDGNDISSTAGTDLTITPLAGQQIVLDGAIIIDAGVVTGATSITSTGFTGELTGNAATVTTNANLTGPITSVGNATSIALQTGTGTTFVMNTSPTLVTPILGVAAATSIDFGATTLLASRALTVDTGGVFNIVLADAAGDDFTVDTDKLVVSGDTGYVGIGVVDPDVMLEVFGATGLKISFDATDNTTLVTDTDGVLTITPSGAAVNFASNITLTGTVDGIDIATDVAANTSHRGDNTQAHTDYLINTGDDITAGSLTIQGGRVTAGTTAQTGTLELYDGSDHKITFAVPSIAGDYTLTLPTTNGDASQFLQTDGAGALTWAAAAGSTDGWTAAGSWSYASASTITVPSGAASIYHKGDKIKWTQTTVKYGVIIGVADTLLTIAVNNDYVVTNAAISANYYSHAETPVGFPPKFAYTPTWGGFSSPTTGSCHYAINGGVVSIWIDATGSGTSNATTLTFSVPVATSAAAYFQGMVIDNSSWVSTSGRGSVSGTTATVGVDASAGPWTASGSKFWIGQFSYPMAA